MSQRPKSYYQAAQGSEPMVWLCAAGLGIVLMMAFALLVLIGVEGLKVFWPHPVALIELAPAKSGDPDLPTTLAGRRVDIVEAEAAPHWRLYLANKDQLDLPFTYVPAAAVRTISFPPELFYAERVRYGPAIGFPLSFKDANGRVSKVSDPDFWQGLQEEVARIHARFLIISRIEHQRLASLNQRLEALGERLEKAHDRGVSASEREALEAAHASLRETFEATTQNLIELRSAQASGTFTYRLADGREVVAPLGNFLTIQRPNAMSLPAKAVTFIANVWRFLTEPPREANTAGGIFPAIVGTFLLTVLMSAAVMPMGVLAALYLSEYARQGPLVRMVRIGVNNLAGVPSIIYGVFGLGFFIYFLGGGLDQLFFGDKLPGATFGTGGLLWASLTLAIMTVPVVIVATEEALASVPKSVREASLACGATQWQTIRQVVLPSAAPGMLTGLILAIARGAGEVAPLMLVGVVKMAPSLPLDSAFPFLHLERKFMHLGFHIYDLAFQSPDAEAAQPLVFATTLLLIVLVIALNLWAILLRNRLRLRFRGDIF